MLAGQVKNVFAVDGRIKTPVEVLQRFQAVEISRLGAAFHQPLLAYVDFVPADQFQELGMTEYRNQTRENIEEILEKRMVEPRGFEPLTPTMPLWCSTN